ncbi:MAG: methyltransferase domain-containing protein [Actinomycetota bacterium]|nr:methyltransferase domain-containing protein [Actinomycetota bacterium]
MGTSPKVEASPVAALGHPQSSAAAIDIRHTATVTAPADNVVGWDGDPPGSVPLGIPEGPDRAGNRTGGHSQESRAERLSHYAATYGADYGFEGVLVAYRHRMLVDLVREHRPATVVEVGCGMEPLVDAVRQREATGTPCPLFEKWVIVEPDASFADRAEASAGRDRRVTVIRGFVEDVAGEVVSRCGQGADLVVCSSLLHELEDPDVLLSALRRIAGPTTLVHVSVPNAGSLHRRLARAMGMIDDIHQLSERNHRFMQHHVYDRASFADVLTNAGFEIVHSGGAFAKLFDHHHMERVPFLTPELLDGLYELGQELPDLAAEIYANMRLPAPEPR